jgi:DNA-binding HxlR family transcriptional regulator
MRVKTEFLIAPEQVCARRIRAIKDTMHVIGGEWKLNILVILSFGPLNFVDLQRRLTGINEKVLSEQLKNLETNKVIVRTPSAERHGRVSYELSSYGWTLRSLIEIMEEWGHQHRNFLFR